MSSWEPWAERWKLLFHQQLILTPEQRRGLPLSVRRFQYAGASTMGGHFIAALDSSHATPKSYLQYRRQLEHIWGEPVVFFLRETPTYQYRRLIKAGVPFFTLNGPAYLPHLYLYLTPGNSSAAVEPLRTLTPAAQALLLRQILFGDMNGCNLRQATECLAYSPMTMTNAKNELLRHKLCRYEGTATRSVLVFEESGEELWQLAQGVLRSPVIKRHFIDRVPSGLPLAGESALAAQTLLSEANLPSYAIAKQELHAYLTRYSIHECDPEDAAATLEQWMYPPGRLMTPGLSIVDSCSLILSLRDSQDDRVLQEAAKLQPHL